ncbi:hypothetical protein STANM309S_06573 [Streptomyces tanashiensis]
MIRSRATPAYAHSWSRRAADSPHDQVRSAALGVLGTQGAGHPAVRELLLRAAAEDPWPEARSTAVRELEERCPGHEGALEVILRRAAEDPDRGDASPWRHWATATRGTARSARS